MTSTHFILFIFNLITFYQRLSILELHHFQNNSFLLCRRVQKIIIQSNSFTLKTLQFHVTIAHLPVVSMAQRMYHYTNPQQLRYTRCIISLCVRSSKKRKRYKVIEEKRRQSLEHHCIEKGRSH